MLQWEFFSWPISQVFSSIQGMYRHHLHRNTHFPMALRSTKLTSWKSWRIWWARRLPIEKIWNLRRRCTQDLFLLAFFEALSTLKYILAFSHFFAGFTVVGFCCHMHMKSGPLWAFQMALVPRPGCIPPACRSCFKAKQLLQLIAEGPTTENKQLQIRIPWTSWSVDYCCKFNQKQPKVQENSGSVDGSCAHVNMNCIAGSLYS